MGLKTKRDPASRSVLLGALSDVGKQRENNQDSMCSIAAPNTPDGISALMAVADGMGGHRGGEVASAIAIQGVVTRLGKSNGAGAVSAVNSRSIAETLRQIHADVAAASTTPETTGMGTTLSVVVLKPGCMLVGHVGDSRVYRLRDGKLAQLTQDHSYVADEVRKGNISREEAESHPMRNVLTQAVGHSATLDPMVGEFDVVAGDKILLCSDGLHGLVSSQYIQRVMTKMPPESAVQALIDRANEAGGFDNITAVIAEIVTGSDESSRTHLSEMETITINSGIGWRFGKYVTWPIRVILNIPRKLILRMRGGK
jgi:PPM family protein phosphatase